MKKRLVQMGIAGGVVLVGLATFGIPVARALPFALLLACPLMMMFMMTGMNHGGGNGSAGCGHDHSGHEHSDHDHAGHDHVGHGHGGPDPTVHEPGGQPRATTGRVWPDDYPQ